MRKCDVIKKLTELVLLDYNWNLNGAVPIFPECIRNAKLILDYISEKNVNFIINNLKSDFLRPQSDGTIQIDFEFPTKGDAYDFGLTLEILPTRINYTIFKNDVEHVNNVSYSNQSFDQILDILTGLRLIV